MAKLCKEICQMCFEEYARTVEDRDYTWTDGDEEMWRDGKLVYCMGALTDKFRAPRDFQVHTDKIPDCCLYAEEHREQNRYMPMLCKEVCKRCRDEAVRQEILQVGWSLIDEMAWDDEEVVWCHETGGSISINDFSSFCSYEFEHAVMGNKKK